MFPEVSGHFGPIAAENGLGRCHFWPFTARFWLQKWSRASWSRQAQESYKANIAERFLSSSAILDRKVLKTGPGGVI